ncbi:MAG: hypothetical protein HN356_04350 [Calditrichaeota bacterium]|jgi:hypothetical protein|nr:hypothetical protein [Calditrichota bacterium]MBT7617368.1 hypothetical protein [Calditrichota bacterium]MBT7790412.1 hypothetical protein [Calditrichota bacterium]
MFEFLDEFAGSFTIGSSKRNLRSGIFLALIIVLFGIFMSQSFLGCSSGGNGVSDSALEAEIKKIDKAIAKFYKAQFTLPEDIGQMVEFGYMEKDGVVWDQWDITFEREGKSITVIEAVSTDEDQAEKTVRFNCYDKMFDAK